MDDLFAFYSLLMGNVLCFWLCLWGFFYLRHLAWDYINFRILFPTLVLPVSVVVLSFFLIRCLAYFIIICLQLLTCIRFVTDWLTTEIYRVDKSHRRLRVTNILSVLFSKRPSIKWDIFFLTRSYDLRKFS